MERQEQAGVSVTELSGPSSFAAVAWLLAALLAHLLLVDAAVETFWGGSPLRWWISPGLLALAALSVWIWRPGGGSLRRFGPAAAAATPLLGLLAVLAITAWLPEGQTHGLRALRIATPALLTGSVAIAVLLAAVVLVRAVVFLGPSARLVARALITTLAVYAVVALGLGLRENTPFAALFHGGALWQQAPRWLQGTTAGGFVLVLASVVVQLARVLVRLGRRQPLGVLLHQATALALVLVMTVSGVYLPSSPSSPASPASPSSPSTGPEAPAIAETPTWTQSLTPQQRVERVERLLQTADTLAKEVPDETFSPGTIVTKVGTDARALAAWVRDNTYWVPYRGALRGPIGVLMDRMGNSLDRSWLLAELLRSAGREVRMARAALSREDAGTLLSDIRRRPDPPRPAAASMDAGIEHAVRYAAAHQLDADSMRQQVRVMYQRSQALGESAARLVAGQAPFLSQSVGSTAFRDDREERALAAIADHWWVQVREAGQWIDLDVLSPNDQGPSLPLLSAQTFPLDSTGRLRLPEPLWQRVTIRARVEHWQGGRFAERTVLEHTFRPAEVFGQSMVLQHMPLDSPLRSNPLLAQGPIENLKTAVLTQHEWLPYLTIGGRQVTQSSFSDDGTVNKNPSLGQKQGSSLGGASGLFGGMFGEEEAPAAAGGVLTAEWIDYEIQVPGARAVTARREVFDLLGRVSRTAAARPAPRVDESLRLLRGVGLLGVTQILPTTCRLSPEYVQRQVLREIAANRVALAAIAASVAAGNGNGVLQQGERLKPTEAALLDLALARFEWSPVAADVYVGTPNLLSYRTTVLPEQGGSLAIQQGFDIVANQVSVQLATKANAFDTLVAQGTADTNAEALLVGKAAVNAGSMLGAGGGPASAWATLRTPGDTGWRDLRWSPEVRARMQADVEAGYVVVAPRGDGAATPNECAWWRVDPRSGVTLGMGSSGWGQGTTERVTLDVVLKAVASFVVTFSLTFTVCAIRKGVLSSTYTEDMDQRVANLRECSCAGLAGGAAVGGAVVGGWAAWVIGMGIASATKEALCG